MLATRGWGVEEFRLATPEFLAACRWMVMVERAVPLYQQAIEVQDLTLTPENAMGKLAATKLIADWEPWLFPEDPDG